MVTQTTEARAMIPAASYVRMSSDKQDRSPDQQRAELRKLAEREGCRIVQEYTDEGITGDSGPDQRPGFKAMLDAARQGRFKVLLAWDTNRIGRFDSLDAGKWLSVLRDNRVQVVTCGQGRIDLESFAGRLVFTVQQEANKMFLLELSAKVLRGQRANAEAGGWNGGPVPFGFDRGEFDQAGNLVRRLAPKQPKSTEAGYRVRLVPVEDESILAGIHWGFDRFDQADISIRALARELQAKGFPSPNGDGWRHATVVKMLANPVYRGHTRWNVESWGKYHGLRGGEITAMNGRGGTRKRNVAEDLIIRPDTHQGLIDPDVFGRVQRKLSSPGRRRYARRAEYPLAGLMYCQQCGQPMHGKAARVSDRKGNPTYHYHRYVCGSYGRDAHRNAAGCGHYAVAADCVCRWLVGALQAEFMGPGRAELVESIRRQLAAEAKGQATDTRRLEKRLDALDTQVSRLVKAIRSTDAPELVDELNAARAERAALQDALQRARRHLDPQDLDREAEGTADDLGALAGRLSEADPATLRELFRLMVSRITCRWDRRTTKAGRQRYPLVDGIVELRDWGPSDCLFSGVANDGASQRENEGNGTGTSRTRSQSPSCAFAALR